MALSPRLARGMICIHFPRVEMKLLVKRRWQKPLSALFEAYARNQERNKMYADVVYRAFHRANVSQISRFGKFEPDVAHLRRWNRGNRVDGSLVIIINSLFLSAIPPNYLRNRLSLPIVLEIEPRVVSLSSFFLFISSRGGGEDKSRSFPLENISFDACRFSRRREGMHILEGIFEWRGMLKRMQLCEAQSASQRGRISRRLCKYRERERE